MKPKLIYGMLLAGVLAAVVPAAADETPKTPAAEQAATAAAEPATRATDDADAEAGVVLRRIPGEAPDMSGLVAVRDAETGELRAPTPEEMQGLQSTVDPLMRSDAGLVERHYPDGTIGVRLEGRFQSMAVVHRDAETGEVTPTCSHSATVVTRKLAQDQAERKENPDVR
ncbi:MAG: hypothetical protein AAGF23_02615 [Acidobacteriota bacterium]